MWTLVSCRQDKTKDYKSREDFFAHPKFGGEYANTLPLHSVDSIVERIAADVPDAWQGFACENVYYHLPDNASDSFELAYVDKIERAFPHDSVRAFSQLMRGEILGMAGSFDTALVCLNDCYAISIKGKRLLRASDAQFMMGQLASIRSDYPEGIRLVTIAYDIAASMNGQDGGRLFETMFALGGMYRNIQDYEMARYWYKKLWQYVFSYPNMKSHQIRAAGYLAENYLRMGNLDSAKVLIDTTFRLIDLYQIHEIVGMYKLTRAEINVTLGKCQQAMPDFQAVSLDKANFLAQPRVRSKYNRGLGLAYVCLGQLDSAVQYFQRALNTTDTLRQVDILLQLAKVHEKRGNYTLAIHAERRSQDLRNRTITSQKDKALERAKVQSENEQRIKAIEYQREKTRLWAIIGSLLFVSSLIFALFVARRQKQKRLIVEKEKELVEAREVIQAQVLVKTERELMEKEAALSISERLLTLKNTLIEQLQLQISENTDLSRDYREGSVQSQMDSNAQTDSDAQTDNDNAADTQQFYRMKILTNADWLHFRERFDDAFPRFNSQLRQRHRDLTNSEIRLFILLKIGFNSSEISSALGISLDSVYKSRYRLRKKLGLKEDLDLEGFIQAF
jgi:tetratricopeptide (TPR) repeat protein